MSVISDLLKDDVKRSVLLLVVSAASLVISFSGVMDWSPVDPAWVAIVLCGAPILWDAVTGLVLRHDIKADVLVAMAIIAAICLQEWFAAGEVALIMEIGGLLEDISAAKANKGIEHLASLMPVTGRIVGPDGEREVPVEEIPIDSIVRVRPGESVPVDGVIVSGTTSIDQSVITGESVPVDRTVGDGVFSGTMNQMGAFDMRVTKASEDSSIQRMTRMVSSVDADKTRMVRVADRWATYLVAIVMVLALATFIVTRDIYRAVTVMIVFCPCAFILATPTAVVAAIGNLTKHGVLVKDGDSLERMSEVDTVVFDKTGTITVGRPTVVDRSTVIDPERFDLLVVSAESMSEHPLGKAMVSGIGGPRIDPESFTMTVGRGVSASVDGSDVLIGNMCMMEESGIDVPGDVLEKVDSLHEEGCTSVFVAVDGSYAGTVTLSDTIRDESATAVSELKVMGIDTILLTGDNECSASHIAKTAGIDSFTASCVPETKLERISELQDNGSKVCMVGDGVNDAPALRKAWVGMAMGGAGTDIAVDAADMALVKDGIGEIPHVIDVSRLMMGKVRHNIVFSLCWNFIAVALAMTAVLGPVEGAIIHNVGSVVVVVNSALLLIHNRR